MIYDAAVDGWTVRAEVRASGEGRYTVRFDGRTVEVDVHDAGPHAISMIADGRAYDAVVERRDGGYRVLLRGQAIEVALMEASRGAVAARRAVGGPARVQAPMPGKLVRVLVRAGEDVGAGQGLVVMEAMKMENEIRAPRAGRVKEAPVREGQAVETGALLVLLE
ncbi:MAG TPA: biotin/lipoyl-containing protein [Vicinamibacteria bacterium]|nr:biotin/lipoyl-containing protein [Vicinamibacteria bacterium]